MSGTSMDGIDIALIRSDGQNIVERGPVLFVADDDKFRRRIEQGLIDAKTVENSKDRPGDLGALEDEITSRHQLAVEQFLDHFKIDRSEIDLVGFHGQTILHRPDQQLTVQLGSGQKLADGLGVEVIYDLRSNDMANGGQGAPLVPVYHRALRQNIVDIGSDDASINSSVALINIGGISNITYVGGDGLLIAFDCGPGNVLIDKWVQRRTGHGFDEGGNIAITGEVIASICQHYMDHRYFDLPVPKSLDRNDFDPLEDDNISIADGARSLAHVTALSINRAVEHLPVSPKIWVVCGGGTLNKVIMDDLGELAKKHNASTKVVTAEEVGLNSMAIEAEAFAYLAIRSKLGAVITYPTTTGCSQAVNGGKSAKPSS